MVCWGRQIETGGHLSLFTGGSHALGHLDGLATSPAGGHAPPAGEVALAKLFGPLLRKQTLSIFCLIWLVGLL